jgi:1,3-propanediol dehydrogenase/alcohol dehydrogenase
LDRALEQLPNAVVFDKVPENPDTNCCEGGATRCREAGCDVVIAIGGGSPMDAAKAIAGLALNDSPCGQYYGVDLFTNGVLPIITVPTTAGSGSEVTPYAVIVDAESQSKKTIKGKDLFPKANLLDPELTVPLPRDVTINTGLDALSQCIEGIVSKTATPVGDALAVDGIETILWALPQAANQPDDLTARGAMLRAAMQSGCVIAQAGTTLVHGMGYPYTLEYGIAHGLANGLLLPPLFAHNAEFVPDRVRLIARAMGVESPEEVPGAIIDLFKTLDVSPAARDHGVDRGRLPELAEEIAANPYRFRNQPGPIDESRVLAFYEASWAGTG